MDLAKALSPVPLPGTWEEMEVGVPGTFYVILLEVSVV